MNQLNEEGKTMFLISKQQGSVIVKILFFIPLLVLLVFGFYEGRKAYWDYQVKEMCERDGGITIYKKEILPDMYVHKDGSIHIPFEVHAAATDKFFIRTERMPIVEGYLSVGKHKTQLIRANDKEVMAELITYGRGGGDFPTFAHPSHISCQLDGNPLDLMIRQVFSNGK